ncbi:class I SAM-dependent methyltransferase [Candidatus Symbiobacter mobilis]|uniref:Methyltransferase type 11 n=1 Tax=Candidatus Symbiobacter mobilis CR TaxID=946483 RepID=U5N498_9BURK|nr:class I SAM-dependent methyltransferase [Candidatus Symbiobacter mobilis]AGX86147.1 methyltransferase type 11 [Candidatus Symbiobacter mobilis CR]
MNQKNLVRNTLMEIGAIHEKDVELFAGKTRDRDALPVYIDRVTGVIFIDDFYVGEHEYASGHYRRKNRNLFNSASGDLEDILDSERRYSRYRRFAIGKKIVDFGCGRGGFLRLVYADAATVVGVELQQDFAKALSEIGISCVDHLDNVLDGQDTFFMFHSLEHLPDPLQVLSKMHDKLKSNGNGKIIIEVPHAKDILIKTLKVQSFIDFTLWSQHLVLHTRDSLTRLLKRAGFNNILIEGVQRYGLTNHLQWLRFGQPGGHKELFSAFETDNLTVAYGEALARIDATDTLVAVAET